MMRRRSRPARAAAAPTGADLRRVGVHPGLAPVLDVVRDVRRAGWSRPRFTVTASAG